MVDFERSLNWIFEDPGSGSSKIWNKILRDLTKMVMQDMTNTFKIRKVNCTYNFHKLVHVL